jgi:hypothetical protein
MDMRTMVIGMRQPKARGAFASIAAMSFGPKAVAKNIVQGMMKTVLPAMMIDITKLFGTRASIHFS